MDFVCGDITASKNYQIRTAMVLYDNGNFDHPEFLKTKQFILHLS